jgi:hypothetical protein
MAKLLLLTGPQGAGNHLWSKIFSLHPEVYGWKSLLTNYWEAHRFAEPFANCWKDHTLLNKFNWEQSEYYFTSISCPLGIVDSDINPVWNPNITGFANAVREQGVDVQIAIIGRDQTILSNQQTRIRTQSTMPLFLEQLDNLCNPTFLSYELLYLYKQNYLASLTTTIKIPVAWDDSRVDDILTDDANVKYIHNIVHNELDNGNKFGTTFKVKP